MNYQTLYKTGIYKDLWHLYSGHRFHFNGKEGDDEVKGEGNSYDFGARIYDPRLGRWMSVDQRYIESPFVSPYKANGNNPIIFADPDGNKEYITILITDEKTGNQTMIRLKVSDNVMTDGIKHPYNGFWSVFGKDNWEVHYFDFETVTYMKRKEDGTLIPTGISKRQLIKDNNQDGKEDVKKEMTGTWFDIPQVGSIINNYEFEGDGGYQGSGIMLYTKEGGAMSTKWKSKKEGDVLATDIENVLIAFGALKGSTVPSIKEALGNPEFVQTLSDLRSSFEGAKKEYNSTFKFKCEACGQLTNDTIATQKEDHNRHSKFEKNTQ